MSKLASIYQEKKSECKWVGCKPVSTTSMIYAMAIKKKDESPCLTLIVQSGKGVIMVCMFGHFFLSPPTIEFIVTVTVVMQVITLLPVMGYRFYFACLSVVTAHKLTARS
jgi:hypothetical protein